MNILHGIARIVLDNLHFRKWSFAWHWYDHSTSNHFNRLRKSCRWWDQFGKNQRYLLFSLEQASMRQRDIRSSARISRHQYDQQIHQCNQPWEKKLIPSGYTVEILVIKDNVLDENLSLSSISIVSIAGMYDWSMKSRGDEICPRWSIVKVIKQCSNLLGIVVVRSMVNCWSKSIAFLSLNCFAFS